MLRKHIWVTAKCPEYRGVFISGVSFKEGFHCYSTAACVCSATTHLKKGDIARHAQLMKIAVRRYTRRTSTQAGLIAVK